MVGQSGGGWLVVGREVGLVGRSVGQGVVSRSVFWGWLVGPSVSQSVCRLVGWLVGRTIGRSVVSQSVSRWVVGQLVSQLVGMWLVGRSVGGWLVGWLVSQLVS